MDTTNKDLQAEAIPTTEPTTIAPKKSAGKLPGKPISFSNHPAKKNGKNMNVKIDSAKKGGHLLKKLTGKQGRVYTNCWHLFNDGLLMPHLIRGNINCNS